ncbi:MAG: type II toxin-antitoxin system VapC family toxin [Spirochaetes bacterium]|nr:type II toxin-antitoxin system VapC family toxin [Spirochaetota bacterium]MBX3724177.1 type II toxin-antitoxin system VapC family toxin [Turneriella sp.]
MAFLIDSDILIYSLKGDARVAANFLKHETEPKYISVISYGELLFGAYHSQKTEKNLAIVYKLRSLFRLLEVDQAVIEIFSKLKAQNRKTGQIVDDMDLLIAATALCNNLTLVSNNEKHFKGIPGLSLKNWHTA